MERGIPSSKGGWSGFRCQASEERWTDPTQPKGGDDRGGDMRRWELGPDGPEGFEWCSESREPVGETGSGTPTEILEARELQRQARAVLRQVALEDEERKDMETEEAMVEDDEWDRMVKDWEEERETVDDGVLRRALLARETRSVTPAPPSRTAARSPAVLREIPEKRLDSSYRPMYNESSPVHQARSDPYSMTSPRMEVGRGESQGRMTEPPPASGMSPLPPGHKPGQGQDSALDAKKDQTGTTVTAGLAEKLQAKRNALRPFGIPPGLAQGDATARPSVRLEDDDPDLEMPETETRPSE